MRNIVSLTFAVSVFLFVNSSPARAEEPFDKAVSDSATFILKELKFSKKLENKKIAVFGFRDSETRQVCKALTFSLVDKITASIQQIKNFSDIPFTVVARSSLEAMEMEHVISSGGDAADLLEGADILITGTWQKGQGSFNLRAKALEVGVGKSRELTSVSKAIDKSGLPGPVLDCLEAKGGKAAGAEGPEGLRPLQEKIADYNRRIEEMRNQARTEQRKAEMLSMIEKQREVIETLGKKGPGPLGSPTPRGNTMRTWPF